MRDERYETSNQADKRTIADLRLGMSRRGDFIEWLFDHSEHCDHIPYSEAWKEFELWEEAQYLQDAPDDDNS